MSSPFVCGIRRFSKHNTATVERPSNIALHQENQQSLNRLLQLREQQDSGCFMLKTDLPLAQELSKVPFEQHSVKEQIYTPWKTPSTN